eukprot:5519784-Prorocentrum_lima.AAC.1
MGLQRALHLSETKVEKVCKESSQTRREGPASVAAETVWARSSAGGKTREEGGNLLGSERDN